MYTYNDIMIINDNNNTKHYDTNHTDNNDNDNNVNTTNHIHNMCYEY